MSDRTIYVSQGQVSYVGGTVTETTGKDITADTILLGIGSYSEPPAETDGQPPDVDQAGATTASRVVKLLIDNSYAVTPRPVWLWAWIADTPEVEPIRLDGPFTIA